MCGRDAPPATMKLGARPTLGGPGDRLSTQPATPMFPSPAYAAADSGEHERGSAGQDLRRVFGLRQAIYLRLTGNADREASRSSQPTDKDQVCSAPDADRDGDRRDLQTLETAGLAAGFKRIFLNRSAQAIIKAVNYLLKHTGRGRGKRHGMRPATGEPLRAGKSVYQTNLCAT